MQNALFQTKLLYRVSDTVDSYRGVIQSFTAMHGEKKPKCLVFDAKVHLLFTEDVLPFQQLTGSSRMCLLTHRAVSSTSV